MSIKELSKLFNQIKDVDDFTKTLKFTQLLTSSNEQKYLDYHYSLISKFDINHEVYESICRCFKKHGKDGETYLLKKINIELDVNIRAVAIQILGEMLSYSDSSNISIFLKTLRKLLNSEEVIIRNKSTIVIGWLGNPKDIDLLEKKLYSEIDNETRGWTATALMQMYSENEKWIPYKNKILKVLKKSLEIEKNDFVVNCILVSLQEILAIKLGLSSTSKKQVSNKKLEKAKIKALELLKNIK